MNEYNTKFFHAALLFVSMISGQLSAQLNADLTAQKLTLDDQVLEIKKEIAGGGTIDLLDATTQRIDGICSFDKNRLDTGRAFVFEDIAIMYKNDAAQGKEGSLSYNGVAPVELQNALVVISQEGREVIRLPFIDLCNIEAGQKASDEYTKLKSFRYFADNRAITIQLRFPPGVALPNTTKHYIHVRLSGLQTTKKAS